jgi:hypothetical protein
MWSGGATPSEVLAGENQHEQGSIRPVAAILRCCDHVPQRALGLCRTILKCGFSNLPMVYFTIYDDGTPVRIGNSPGVGSRGLLFRDPRNKTMVIIEQNLDGVPDTFTTITGDMTGIHSRALLNPDGSVSSPTQGIGRCQVAPIR